MSYRTLVLTLVLMGCAATGRAQQPFRLQIAAGRVTLHAQNIPVRTILSEWSRLGGARVVNGEAVVGAPLTLDLENVPERQALDIILRGVSGYMLAARDLGVAGGPSMFDRIMILPTSSAPRNPPPASASPIFGNTSAPVAMRPILPPRPPDAQEAADDNDGPEGPGVQTPGLPMPGVPMPG